MVSVEILPKSYMSIRFYLRNCYTTGKCKRTVHGPVCNIMKNDLVSLFRKLTHGVYVIGVSSGSNDNAFTAAWVMQVSFKPLMLALGIHPDHSSCSMLLEGGTFTVNVLPSDRMDLAEHFGRPATTDKFAGIKWHRSKTGVPVLDDAMAWFECRFSHECSAGDHVLVVGRVVDGSVVHPGAEPMNYRDTGDMDGSSSLFPEEF